MNSIDINKLNALEKQVLVCLFFARMPKDDIRYKLRKEYWQALEDKYHKKWSTYRNYKDALDPFFSENGRIVWTDKPLEKRGAVLADIYDKYKDADDIVLQTAVEKIISECRTSTSSYIAVRIKKPEDAHAIINGEKTVTVDGVQDLADELKIGKTIFVALGGDKGKAEVDWKTGFFAIAHVSKEPYDIGYTKDRRGKDYFKFNIDIDLSLGEAISREEFINYPDTYDASYIGLEIHRDRTQALSSLEDAKAIAIIRATMDLRPDLSDKFDELFDKEFMDCVRGDIKILVPASVSLGKSQRDALQSYLVEQEIIEQEMDEDKSEAHANGGSNELYYGVPGSGKSHLIDEKIGDAKYERVVFYPDYTYSDFVGQIMPQLTNAENGEQKLTYGFVPGPFTKALKAAVESPDEMFFLVIEEINRGNAPAIFGDIFQLLDRNEDGSSRYHITNFDIAKEIYGDKYAAVNLPGNISILATMNTSDQNVFTLDTAFQRRWNMKYVENNIGEADHAGEAIECSDITWGRFASVINDEIIDYNSELLSSEDKQLGAYFVTRDELTADKFPEKALKYLWDDAFKMEREKVFDDTIKSIGDLVRVYKEEVKRKNDPIKRVMKAEVYRKMMDMTAQNIAEAIDESEVFESKAVDEEF